MCIPGRLYRMKRRRHKCLGIKPVASVTLFGIDERGSVTKPPFSSELASLASHSISEVISYPGGGFITPGLLQGSRSDIMLTKLGRQKGSPGRSASKAFSCFRAFILGRSKR